MNNCDVYECIRNEEIREFFRSKGLTVWEQIQIILHSYASMQKKREWLVCLSQQVAEDKKQQISNMIELIDTCLYQIYQTEENVLYIAERRFTPMDRRKWGDEDIKCSSPDGAELTFHDEMVKMTEYLSRTYVLEPDENNEELYIYQIIKAPHKKHRIKLEFSMTWMEGKLEIFQIFPDKEWLERKGIPEETIDDFEDAGIMHKELPFKQGDRLKIKTPLMPEYIHGTLTWAEYDGCGCWYYFFTPDGKEMDIDAEKYTEDMIDLSYHEIDLTMGYTVFDWVERE